MERCATPRGRFTAVRAPRKGAGGVGAPDGHRVGGGARRVGQRRAVECRAVGEPRAALVAPAGVHRVACRAGPRLGSDAHVAAVLRAQLRQEGLEVARNKSVRGGAESSRSRAPARGVCSGDGAYVLTVSEPCAVLRGVSASRRPPRGVSSALEPALVPLLDAGSLKRMREPGRDGFVERRSCASASRAMIAAAQSSAGSPVRAARKQHCRFLLRTISVPSSTQHATTETMPGCRPPCQCSRTEPSEMCSATLRTFQRFTHSDFLHSMPALQTPCACSMVALAPRSVVTPIEPRSVGNGDSHVTRSTVVRSILYTVRRAPKHQAEFPGAPGAQCETPRCEKAIRPRDMDGRLSQAGRRRSAQDSQQHRVVYQITRSELTQ